MGPSQEGAAEKPGTRANVSTRFRQGSPLRGRLNGGLFLSVLCLFGLLWVQDPTLFVTGAHINSGSGGRTRRLARKRLGEHKGPPQDEHLSPPSSYRSNAQLLAAMREFAIRCSNISRLYTIGKSVKGVPLMVLEISDFPGQFEPEPAFKYVGNMHGDEPSGRELILLLAEWLCANYLKDSLATLIVQNLHLHLLPSMNPDGFERKTRTNANDIDLNRDFPDQFFRTNNNESGRQPETKAIMKWIRNTQFVASASLHEGALVASYGWDGTLTGRTGYAESPDDGGFQYMAYLYAQFNPLMKSREFPGGVTNGAAWYPLYGGMQDWNYIYGNCFEITLEMNEKKWPDISKIPELWEQHRQSMLELVASVVKSGVHGRVISSADGGPLQATITVKGNSHMINASAAFGDYHRILPPGKTYELTAKLPGYMSRSTTIVLPINRAMTLDFVLDPVPTSEVYQQSSPRISIASGVHEWDEKEKLALRCVEAGFADLQQPIDGTANQGFGLWLPRKNMMRSWEGGDIVSEIAVDYISLVCVLATVTILGMAILLCGCAKWRGSHRSVRLAVKNSNRC